MHVVSSFYIDEFKKECERRRKEKKDRPATELPSQDSLDDILSTDLFQKWFDEVTSFGELVKEIPVDANPDCFPSVAVSQRSDKADKMVNNVLNSIFENESTLIRTNVWVAFQKKLSVGPAKCSLNLEEHCPEQPLLLMSPMMKKYEKDLENLPIFLKEVVDYSSVNVKPLEQR